MIKLRKLQKKDAIYMLEWMHDIDVVKDLRGDFINKSIEDCFDFIESSYKNDEKSLHFAIVNNDDEYMGTVSLKNMSDISAEFAITIRKKAMGQGVSISAMREILTHAISELHLSFVYWCVSCENCRAVRFYEKNGYNRIDHVLLEEMVDLNLQYTREQIEKYVWYIYK